MSEKEIIEIDYALNDVKRGDRIKGKVVNVKEDCILVEIPYAITEGKMYLGGYDNPAPKTFIGLVAVGDEIEAKVTNANAGKGNLSAEILLSRLPLIKELSFATLDTSLKNKIEVTTKVKQALDKGLVLNFEGFEIFLPYSLLDRELVDIKDQLVGKDLNVVIEEIKKYPRLRIVATRKPIYEKARQEKNAVRQKMREEELLTLTTGAIVEGTVEKIEGFGAIVRFNYNMGILRISQISHYRVAKIEDVLHVGQKVTVKIIKVEGTRIDLSMKVLEKTPFELFIEDHKVGQVVKGKVVQKAPFGIFVELARDIQGLLHKNEISWNPKDNSYDYIAIGDEIELVITQINKKDKKISLSKKALLDNPWAKVNFKVGANYDVLITAIDQGIIHVAAQSVDGIIRAKDAVEGKLKLEDHFKVGDTILAKCIKCKPEEWVLEFSVLRVTEEAQRAEFESYLKNTEEIVSTIGDVIDLEEKTPKTKKTKK